ncbi:MAG: DUF481 domain-containing protein [Peredibacter sp.]
MRNLFLCLLAIVGTAQAGEFKHETQLGVVVTGGNTEVEIYNGKTTNTLSWGKDDRNHVTFGGHYMYGTSSGVENSRNWDVNTKYERSLSKTIGVFTGVKVEADEFAGIQLRTNLDAGGTYQIYKKDKSYINSEFGYRYRQEKNLADEVLRQSQARLFLEGVRKKSEEFSMKMTVEYLPNFTIGEDWQLNFEPSFNYHFHNNLALKWGYLGKYDNLPVAGNKKFDFTYTTALIANF